MKSHILGFPSIGKNRELKFALEKFWQNQISAEELQQTAQTLKENHWRIQQENHLTWVATGDFSFYDRMLDTAIFLNALPSRFQTPQNLNDYFVLARGKESLPAMEMTKWFNTNYHYLVPELNHKTTFSYQKHPVLQDTHHAQKLGFSPKPCVIGPLTFLALSKTTDNSNVWDFLPQIVPIYAQMLKELANFAEVIQIEEPILSTDFLPQNALDQFEKTYQFLNEQAHQKLILSTYFGEIIEKKLPLSVDFYAIHIDCVTSQWNVLDFAKKLPSQTRLSIGAINGRNIWKNNLAQSFDFLKPICDFLGHERVILGTSSSLLHVPVDLENETKLPKPILSRLAFAIQKCQELNILSQHLKNNQAPLMEKQNNEGAFVESVRKRVQNISAQDYQRAPFKERQQAQSALNLPLLPTTTIGSFPQTNAIRAQRLKYKKGEISSLEYEDFLKKEIQHCITIQEDLDLDVLVHGEAERGDMVEYFGENLKGFCFTENAWVQSYGSRCVKPPVIYGDVYREKAFTVPWIRFAQSQTKKMVKGMLTGPITILCWSFVREDLPRQEVATQIALAIRDEVKDLEEAGIQIIQIDEAALREGLPLNQKDAQDYLQWAVQAFCLTAGSAKATTQIHTHMCYSEFNAILPAIAQMDADVISIEASRSNMELLNAFKTFHYQAGIGPGVYDIHSPAIPTQEDIEKRIQEMLGILDKSQLWVNPDCGLKTRRWEEVLPALTHLVQAAKKLRQSL